MIKINKINIKEFGSIQNFNLELNQQGPTILYGNNESGKTMILDAILYSLFSETNIKSSFSGFNREYTQNEPHYNPLDLPETEIDKSKSIFSGSVELKIDNSDIVFPQEKNLDEIISIPPLFASNIFVVRDGDLKFNHTENWWNLLKSRLAGFSGDYLRITNKINETVGINSYGEWINSEDNSIGNRYEELNEKLNNLRELKIRVRELEELELKHSNVSAMLEKCQKKINNLNTAKRKYSYVKSKMLVDKHKKIQKKIVEYEKYNPSNLKIWRNTEIEVLKAKEIIELSKKHRDNYTALIDKDVKEIEQSEKEIEAWTKVEKEFIPALETKLADHKQKKAKLQRGSSAKSMMPLWLIVSVLSLIFTVFISLIINPVFYTISAIIFVALCYNVKVWFSSKGTRSSLESLERIIKENFKKIENKEESIDNINDWLFEKRNTNQELTKNVRITRTKKLPDLEKIAKELTTSINTLDDKLQKLESFTVALQRDTGCSTWEELQTKCNEKETLEVNLKMLTEQINQLLDTKLEMEWEDKIVEPETLEDVGIKWNSNIAKQQNELYQSLSSDLKEMDDKIVKIKIDAGQLGCRNLEEVWLKEDEIKTNLTKLESDKEAALITSEIIESISKEQDKLINSFIESDDANSASDLFSKITDNKYKKVFLERNNIYVNTNDETILHAAFLSSGTLAQLYFTIRVNFAENLLENSPAFLLLDDPFLACDNIRKSKMINILKDKSDKGWQFIYFTIDESIVNRFKDCFKDNLQIHNLT